MWDPRVAVGSAWHFLYNDVNINHVQDLCQDMSDETSHSIVYFENYGLRYRKSKDKSTQSRATMTN